MNKVQRFLAEKISGIDVDNLLNKQQVNELLEKKENDLAQYLTTISSFNNLFSSVMIDNPKKVKIFGGWVFACINTTNNYVSQLNFYPEKLTNDGYVPYPQDHWINYLFNHVNQLYSFNTLKRIISDSIQRTGKAFVWVPAEKLPYAMYFLRTENVTIQTSSDKMIEKFIFNGNGKTLEILPENMIYIKTLSLDRFESSLFDGVPVKINAAMDTILTAGEKKIFARDYMTREGSEPYILKATQEFDTTQLSNFLENVRNKVPEAFRPKTYIPFGMDIANLTAGTNATTANDVNYSEMVDEICAIMGVAKDMILGKLLSRTTSITVKEMYYEGTVYPYAEMIKEEFTKHFKQYEPDFELNYDKYSLLDPEFELKQNESDFDRGIKSQNEIRLERGYAEIENGDIRLIKTGYTKLEDVHNPPAIDTGLTFDENTSLQEIELMLKKKSIMSNTDELVKKLYWKALNTFNNKYELQYIKIISDTFLDLQEEILDNNNLSKCYDNIPTIEVTTFPSRKLKRVTQVENIKLFDLEKWVKILTLNTNPITSKFIKAVFRRSAKDINESIVLTDYEKQIAKLSKNTTDKITTSLGTIEQELQREIAKIVEINPTASKQELLDIFKEKLSYKFKDVFSESRSKLIAQTTTTYTSGQGQKLVWNSKGYAFMWLTQRDGVVRPSHDAMDGTLAGEDGLFNVNGDRMETPGGGSVASENVNCRCYGLPVRVAK
ncbi:MAG: phage portal protein [Bacteroidia bacterium]|nr:phage portal protein [Bacteroidia bacterium]